MVDVEDEDASPAELEVVPDSWDADIKEMLFPTGRSVRQDTPSSGLNQQRA